ncbi:MAG: LapA family protein [Inhella sp.]
MKLLTWLLRLFLFFTLFAFALNNSQEVIVHWFFGYQWSTPLVIVVLIAFALGAAFGIVAMVPAWWRHRREARRHAMQSAPVSDTALPPIRDGL